MRLKVPLGSIGHLLRSRPANSVKSGLFGNALLTSPKGFARLNDLVEQRVGELVYSIVQRDSASSSGERPISSSGRFKSTVSMVDDLSNEICCAADLVKMHCLISSLVMETSKAKRIHLTLEQKLAIIEAAKTEPNQSELARQFTKKWNLANKSDCVRNMHCDPSFSKAAEESMRKFTILVETLNTTPELYESLKVSLIRESGELDEVSIRTAKLLLEDFEHSGVHLQEDDRMRFVSLSNAIFEASANFMENVDRPVKVDESEARQFGFPFDELSGPLSSTSDYRLRKYAFTKYFQHNDVQEEHLKRLVDCRTQLAKLTGFETFAHRAQKHAILQNYDNVENFLKGVIESAKPHAKAEIEEMRAIVTDHSKNFKPGDPIGEWDVEFATTFRRQQTLNQIGEASKNALYLDSVLRGFESLVNSLYGLSFQLMMPELGELWPGNVIKMHGVDFLGTIYLDIDNRPSKVQGDCHFTVRCSKLMDDGKYQTPIVVISLAIVPPEFQSHYADSLSMLENYRLSIQQAENFFHEMGHAIHSMLGRTRFQHVAGTRCPTDFAEVPSHLMECFFNDSQVLMKIFENKSGYSISEEQANALVSSRNNFKNVHLLQQSLYALFDLCVHGDYANDFASGKLTSTELFGDLAKMALPGLERVPNYAYHHRISHLVTYGAKYYSYLLARSTASLIYQKLFINDPFSRINGLKWAEIQSHGGEYPSHYLLQKVLGEAPTAEQLTDVLVPKERGDDASK